MPRVEVCCNEGSLDEKWRVLGWTMLKACLKDQQVVYCIDMKLCDNEENNY